MNSAYITIAGLLMGNPGKEVLIDGKKTLITTDTSALCVNHYFACSRSEPYGICDECYIVVMSPMMKILLTTYEKDVGVVVKTGIVFQNSETLDSLGEHLIAYIDKIKSLDRSVIESIIDTAKWYINELDELRNEDIVNTFTSLANR